MRGKRSKQYRKLMQQYALAFGFREPYQVLVDADMLKDADSFKMDLIGGLERTLQGQVKPMITQCSMRHLYARTKEPGMSFVIDKAKLLERRRCGHLPEDYAEPLSAHDCIMSVVDGKSNKTNKHRYVVACQDTETRRALRGVRGVPLVYVNRSVMVMEPMAEASERVRDSGERAKFRDGLRRGASGAGPTGEKRKRGVGSDGEEDEGDQAAEKKKKTKKAHGVKGPNPLSVKKKVAPTTTSKKPADDGAAATDRPSKPHKSSADTAQGESTATADGTTEGSKKKRRRKHKAASGGDGAGDGDGEGEADRGVEV